MPSEDDYPSWVESRRECEVPEDFADRVMSAVHQRLNTARASMLPALFLGLLAHRTAKITVGLLACGACILRIYSVVSLYLGSNIAQ
jgi:hypothetical protein